MGPLGATLGRPVSGPSSGTTWGKITHLIAGFLGENTNNVAELSSLVKGLQMAVQNQHSRLIFEGDSQVIIQLATRILNGQPPWRTSPSWRLLGLLEDFKDLINPNLILIPSHVRREANKVADHLANKGIDAKADLIYWQANYLQRLNSLTSAETLLAETFRPRMG
jgi:ribonuclease HI